MSCSTPVGTADNAGRWGKQIPAATAWRKDVGRREKVVVRDLDESARICALVAQLPKVRAPTPVKARELCKAVRVALPSSKSYLLDFTIPQQRLLPNFSMELGKARQSFRNRISERLA